MLFHKKCKIFTAAGVAEVIASQISFSFFTMVLALDLGLPCGSAGKESTCNVGDRVRSLGWEDPLEKEIVNPLQYSCLENPMEGGAW